MRLQVSRLPGNPSIAHAVRFIETVTGKVHHEIEDIVGRAVIDAVGNSAVDERFPVLLQDFRFLMAHSTAEHICLSKAEPAHDGCNLHDLFLIKDDPVRFLQNRFQ